MNLLITALLSLLPNLFNKGIKGALNEVGKLMVEGASNRKDIATKKHEMTIRQMEVKQDIFLQNLKVQSNADVESQKQRRHTLIDEYLIILGTIPFILIFIDEYQEIMFRGFEILSNTPPWYVAILFIIYLTTLGGRGLLPKISDLFFWRKK